MTQLLLRLFIKNRENTADPLVRSAIGSLSGITGIVCNLLLFAAKLLIGTISGSVSITADAMNNLSDATSSIVTLIGFRLARQPADESHPYGHARFEYLAGLAVAAMVVVIGFELAKTSVAKICTPAPVVFSSAAATVLLLSIAMKLWMYLFNRRLGKMIGSTTLLATAADSRNDCLTTGTVFLAAVIESVTGLTIAGFMGLGVALFILWSGANLAKETVSPLLGEGASPELKATIAQLVSSHPKVLGYHDLMVHDYGPGQRFATLHVEMDSTEDVLTCHEIIDRLERKCYNKYGIHLVIHHDPIVTGDPEVLRLKALVEEILQQYDQRLQLHDFRMVPGRKHINLLFDVVLPADLNGREDAILQHLETLLTHREEQCFHILINFDPAAFHTD